MNDRYATPEEMGISSRDIEAYLSLLEKKRLATHSVIIARKGKIVLEEYYAPFHREEKHRMYSVTKSFVSLAIGFLLQEGKIALDDPLSLYFPVESRDSHPFQRAQTIRHTLMMATAIPNANHFRDKPKDRVAHYFANHNLGAHPSGTVWRYDSEGSFVLGALVERVTGRKLMDYLDEKLFSRIGVEKPDCLECVGGHSWSDSALLCRPLDLLRVAEFCMHYGEGILDEAYLREATANLIDNGDSLLNEFNHRGYGYLFWRTGTDSFLLNGMGCQLALCFPEKDLILVYNGDNQGNDAAKSIILDHFTQMIANRVSPTPLPADLPVEKKERTLIAASGMSHSPLESTVGEKVYRLEENPMNITCLSLHFGEKEGVLRFTNQSGKKEIPFGLCENRFSLFPEKGYSDRVATLPGDRLYRCAASGAWLSDNTLLIKVQIIDTYLGNLNIKLSFLEKGIGVVMKKSAEDFLNEYQGWAGGFYE